MSPPATQPPERPEGPRIVLGAMSGTSADGVDVAAAEITGRGLGMQAKYLAHVEHPYAPELRRRIFAIRESGEARLDELAGLGREITLSYAAAVRELLKQMSLDPRRVAGLAAHGQTLYHAPPESIQWLDPSLLAAETDLAVISDFRRADLAAGGQGAPLVPFADWILFRHPTRHRAVFNFGGIANLTCLFAGKGIEAIWAFDTGPANCVIDELMRRYRPDGPGFDKGGHLASSGKVNRGLLDTLNAHPYFVLRGPKSTDAPQMIRIWDEVVGSMPYDLQDLPDLLATACAWAGVQAALPLALYGGRFEGDIIVAGGGINNSVLMKMFSAWAGSYRPTDDLGLPSQAREAVAFAILGAATLDNEPSNVPSATGARRRVVLGSVTPRPGT